MVDNVPNHVVSITILQSKERYQNHNSKKIPSRFSEYSGRGTKFFLRGDIDTFRIYDRNETKRKRLYKIEDRLFLFYSALFADDFKKNVTKYLDISLFGRDKERI